VPEPCLPPAPVRRHRTLVQKARMYMRPRLPGAGSPDRKAFSKVASAEVLRIAATGPESVKDFEAFSRRIGCDPPESTEDGRRFYHRPGKAWS